MGYAAAGHRVEINLSAQSISEPGLFRYVEEQLAAHRVDPRLVVFEITETALIHNEGVAQVFIANVRRAGLRAWRSTTSAPATAASLPEASSGRPR